MAYFAIYTRDEDDDNPPVYLDELVLRNVAITVNVQLGECPLGPVHRQVPVKTLVLVDRAEHLAKKCERLCIVDFSLIIRFPPLISLRSVWTYAISLMSILTSIISLRSMAPEQSLSYSWKAQWSLSLERLIQPQEGRLET